MIDIERLKKVRTIVTHAHCPDGYASAAILKHAIPLSEVFFLSYGTREFSELPANPNMLFCDFSPPSNRVDEFIASETIVLDHHKSAKPVLDRFIAEGLGVFADETLEPGVSGAMLAYRDVLVPMMGGNAQIREFAELAGIRDTWQTKSEWWRMACSQAQGLRLYGERVLTQLCFSHYDRQDIAELMRVGSMLQDRHEKSVADSVKQAFVNHSFTKARIAIVHNYGDVSDAAESFGDSADLVMGFRYLVDDGALLLNVSVRSHTYFDCAAFAKRNGGGGHTRAAGFSIPYPKGDPHNILFDLVKAYEKCL